MEKQLVNGQEVINYLRSRVMTILQPLQIDILNQRPLNIYHFSMVWLQNYSENQMNKLEIANDEEEPDEIFKARVRSKLMRNKCFRVGVSGQCYSRFTPTKTITETNSKSQETKIRLLIELRNSILFKNLNHENIIDIISTMKEVLFKSGEEVIKEGQVGNQLYIVDSGSFKCTIKDKQDIKMYGPGEAFGELSLLYGTRRASTIVAETDGKLFKLQRLDFNRILRDSILRKTEMCQNILSKVQIFSSMDIYQKSKLYENLQQINISPGKYIIRQGQLGDCFYIVAEGKLVAEKDENGEIKSVYYYKEGDYFGEIALIRNVPRQASVKSLTKAKLVYIERSAFKRILGPLEHILKRNEARYKKIKEQSKNNML